MALTATPLPQPESLICAKLHNGLASICSLLRAGWDVRETWGEHFARCESRERGSLDGEPVPLPAPFPPCKVVRAFVATST